MLCVVSSLQSDQANVLSFVDHVIQHLKENFVNGKMSKSCAVFSQDE